MWTTDPEISHQGQAQAAANRRAVDGRHHGLGAGKQAQRFEVNRVDAARAVSTGGVTRLAKVGPGAKGGALGAQHAAAQLGVGVNGLEGESQVADQRQVEVVVRRAADFDDGHVLLVADVDVTGVGWGGGGHDEPLG